MKGISIAVLLSALALAGCAEPVRHLTPSGRPEVCVHNAPPAQISTVIAAKLLDAGYIIVQQNNTLVQGERHQWLVGLERVTLNIVPLPECTRVVANLAHVHESQEIPMNDAEDSQWIQPFLDDVKSSYEGQR